MTDLNLKLEIELSRFFAAMRKKLKQKEAQGYKGWDNPELKSTLIKQLNNNVEDEDWVDVANLAMILDYLQKFTDKNNVVKLDSYKKLQSSEDDK